MLCDVLHDPVDLLAIESLSAPPGLLRLLGSRLRLGFLGGRGLLNLGLHRRRGHLYLRRNLLFGRRRRGGGLLCRRLNDLGLSRRSFFLLHLHRCSFRYRLLAAYGERWGGSGRDSRPAGNHRTTSNAHLGFPRAKS
jgi:hypothetical protein